ncbi:4-hydroxyphenylacetate 3-hydroxylase family protein [Chloroflexota bacterium]
MRSSAEYISDLEKMKPNVYLGGKKVGRDDQRIRPCINVVSVTFDLARDPKWQGLITVKSSLDGREVSRFTQPSQNAFELMQKQKMIRLLAQRVGGCIQRCMGWDALAALSVVTREIDEEYGTKYNQRFLKYLGYCQEHDIAAAGAQTDMKGDRLKRPSEQPDPDAYVHIVEKRKDGIVVRGAKICITMAAYADEIIVIPTRALQADDKDYAVAFAIPADWDRVSLITRPVLKWERGKLKAPLPEYGVSDSMVIFDDAFIPNERVLMCGEWDFGRRTALLFANSHRHSCTGCKPAVSDILCGVANLVAEANNIDKVKHIRQKLSEYASTAELSYAAGVAAAIFGDKAASGTFCPNAIYANVGRKLAGENIYHGFNILTEVAGGLAVTLPSEAEFESEDTRKYLDKYITRNPKLSPEESRLIWGLVQNIVASPMSLWHQIAGVHGSGSPIMESIALNTEYDYESKKNIAKYLAGINKELDQTKELDIEPNLDIKP